MKQEWKGGIKDENGDWHYLEDGKIKKVEPTPDKLTKEWLESKGFKKCEPIKGEYVNRYPYSKKVEISNQEYFFEVHFLTSSYGMINDNELLLFNYHTRKYLLKLDANVTPIRIIDIYNTLTNKTL